MASSTVDQICIQVLSVFTLWDDFCLTSSAATSGMFSRLYARKMSLRPVVMLFLEQRLLQRFRRAIVALCIRDDARLKNNYSTPMKGV